jgi:hypothetical protein
MKLRHRTCKHGVKTAICLPLSQCAINARVVNFWMAFLIFFDRQLLPLGNCSRPHSGRSWNWAGVGVAEKV